MTVTTNQVNKFKRGVSAPLVNMQILDTLVVKAINRPDHLPGLIGFSGPSGFGKSTAAAYVAAKHQADYLEVKSLHTKKSFLEALALLQRQDPARTASQLMDQVGTRLLTEGRPLIIDEFDYAVDRNLVDIVRDLHEMSKAPIILIGEEKLPLKLKAWERFDGRILAWEQAVPANLEDARTLNAHYEPTITIADDLLAKIAALSKGSVRRIVTNINKVADFARGEHIKNVSFEQWQDRTFYTGTDVKVRGF